MNRQGLCPGGRRSDRRDTPQGKDGRRGNGARAAALRLRGAVAGWTTSVKEEVQDHQYEDRDAQQPTDEILAHDDVSWNVAATNRLIRSTLLASRVPGWGRPAQVPAAWRIS